MNYWLMKSEPTEFGIDDLRKAPGRRTYWDGIRNYQVRNMVRDRMAPGDFAFFYHSNAPETGIAGIMEIVSSAYPDPSAFDPEDKHFDPKSNPDNPRWWVVDVKFRRKLKRLITLSELRQHRQLATMQLLKRGNRLSITPISKAEWDYILRLE